MIENLETPVHSAQKKVVLKAIEDSGPTITVADISQKTGLPVLTSSTLLNQIAYETGGHLKVGTAGSVAYEFDSGFQNAYFTRGSKNFFLRMWRIFVNASIYALRIFSLAMYFLIRVSFGILLILSVVLVVVLVVVVVIALLARFFGDSDSGGDGGFDFGELLGGLGGFFRYWAFDWLWDWWYWGQYFRYDPRPTYYPSKTYLYDEYGDATEKKQSKVSFLDKVFSFLFGDGDPNADFEERYWRTLGLLLRGKKGVVVAEELAPYANVQGSGEDWVLPILVRFNGTCDVTEQGNIIYKFPSFMQSFASSNNNIPDSALVDQSQDLRSLVKQSLNRQQTNAHARAAYSQLDSFLREIPQNFSNIPESSKITIACLAVFIMFGSLALMALAATVPILLLFSPLLMGMACYGALFLIVPCVRYLVMKHVNRGIDERNSKREAAAAALNVPEESLRKKLEEGALARAEGAVESSKETVVYSTTEDNMEQEFKEQGLE